MSQSDPLKEKSTFGLASTTFGCRPAGPPLSSRGSDASETCVGSMSKSVDCIIGILWSLYVVLLIDATINFSSSVSSVKILAVPLSRPLLGPPAFGLLLPLLCTVGRLLVSSRILSGVIGIFNILRAKISLSLSILFKRFRSATYERSKEINIQILSKKHGININLLYN